MMVTLQKTRAFVEGDGGLLLDSGTKELFLDRISELETRVEKAERLLYVGILGGTGVGKSTLINALAQKEISAPSPKRPFTDRAVVYRHRDTQRGLEHLVPFFLEPDQLHDADPLRYLVVIDLPDFDSREKQNRETVLQILPSLDCILWVVTPEKYADAAFYAFVPHAVINQANFTFVLNKCDELTAHTDSEKGHQAIKEMLGDLVMRLSHEAGLDNPRIFAISAAAALANTSYDSFLTKEFERLKGFLFARREEKEIQAIKAANLDEELHRLLKELHSHIKPEQLAAAVTKIESLSVSVSENLETLIARDSVHQQKLVKAVFATLIEEDASIPLVRRAMLLFTLIGRDRTRAPDTSVLELYQEIANSLTRELRMKLEARARNMHSELLFGFGQCPLEKDSGTPEQLFYQTIHQTAEKFFHVVEQKRLALTTSRARWRRMKQKFVLFLPLPFFAAKIAGPTAIKSFLASPSFGGGLSIVFGFFTSLFGPEGLVGLLALGISEAVCISYLALRRIRIIDRDSRQLTERGIQRLVHNLRTAWEQIETHQAVTIRRIKAALEQLKSIES